MKTSEHEQFQRDARRLIGDLAGEPPTTPHGALAALRRGPQRALAVPVLRRVDDMYVWDVPGTLLRTGAGLQRRAYRRGAFPAEAVVPVPLLARPPNDFGAFLESFDNRLTPNHGLGLVPKGGEEIAWDVPDLRPVTTGRILLLVHGTFSNTATVWSSIGKNSTSFKKFVAWAHSQYDQVLAFDHPTLAVSPMLNALELGGLLAGSTAAVDVVCHSRGGLVSRWWAEVFDPQRARLRRVAFVASPLDGTSLAAPRSLKNVIDLLTNVAAKVGDAASILSPAGGLLGGAVALLGALLKVVRVANSTPALDAAVSLVPGLAAQSRVGNNREILGLQGLPLRPAGYYAVTSDFEPTDTGWNFLAWFRTLGGRIANGAADLVFREANDLVVDTSSMASLGAGDAGLIPQDHVHSFGENAIVHHLNVFEQAETLERMMDWFR